ncbi:hypothetical protein ABIB94_006246 [Bradyrhizobium sp. JR7.2]|uniref:hypothetical protein n=1 Tax=Bradyrhizobium sp. JR7.2 TaxID=3156375 RepID=UPI0033930932
MADATRAAFSFGNAAPFTWSGYLTKAIRMAFELLLIAQMIRRPAQALALPQPVPRLARPVALRRVREIVRRERSVTPA